MCRFFNGGHFQQWVSLWHNETSLRNLCQLCVHLRQIHSATFIKCAFENMKQLWSSLRLIPRRNRKRCLDLNQRIAPSKSVLPTQRSPRPRSFPFSSIWGPVAGNAGDQNWDHQYGKLCPTYPTTPPAVISCTSAVMTPCQVHCWDGMWPKQPFLSSAIWNQGWNLPFHRSHQKKNRNRALPTWLADVGLLCVLWFRP